MSEQFEFQVETGIPIPPKKSLRGKKVIKWPFKDMEVNESVFVPYSISNLIRTISAYQATEKRSEKDISFSYREYETGVRVWRIK